eukprot:g4297.t1
MSYTGTGNTYTYYDPNQADQQGNEVVDGEPEYERHLGVTEVPPNHVFQNTQSNVIVSNAFVQVPQTIMPPVMNMFANVLPTIPQQQAYPVLYSAQQPEVSPYPMMGAPQAPEAPAPPYPMYASSYPEKENNQMENNSQEYTQQGVSVTQTHSMNCDPMTLKRKAILGTIGVIVFAIISIGKTSKLLLSLRRGFVCS